MADSERANMIDQSRQIESAISYIPAIDRELWVEIGMAVKSELGDSGFDLWDRWSSQADSYNEKEIGRASCRERV